MIEEDRIEALRNVSKSLTLVIADLEQAGADPETITNFLTAKVALLEEVRCRAEDMAEVMETAQRAAQNQEA